MQSQHKHSKTLMIQGTASDVGKSALVTALCRYYHLQGIKVAPFKPQNMALNSAVTVDGGEIGRAQAVQATASGVASHTDMNPILLKPNSNKTAQLIIHGKAIGNFSAQQYHHYKKKAMPAVLTSYERLLAQYQMVIVEGAGSPAEINLREGDIANMGFAEAVDCPVILIADIDKGGVFAHIVGTLALLSQSEQKRVVGFVINRFRGDISLLQSGIDWLEQHTHKSVLAVLPYLDNLYLDAEDSLALSHTKKKGASRFNIVIPMLPRMSNHTDFDPLLLHPQVCVQFSKNPMQCGAVDLIILPGSKSVIDDLHWLTAMGWDVFINHHLRYNGKLLGICGGFQMLGKTIYDHKGIEGESKSSNALGFLEMETTLQCEKKIQKVNAILSLNNSPVIGYEIHAGITTGSALNNPVMTINGKAEGAFSDDNLVMGTYVHGLFDTPEAGQAVLNWAGCLTTQQIDIKQQREASINLLANTLADNFNFAWLNKLTATLKNSKFTP